MTQAHLTQKQKPSHSYLIRFGKPTYVSEEQARSFAVAAAAWMDHGARALLSKKASAASFDPPSLSRARRLLPFASRLPCRRFNRRIGVVAVVPVGARARAQVATERAFRGSNDLFFLSFVVVVVAKEGPTGEEEGEGKEMRG